jgi:hypothetical protein
MAITKIVLKLMKQLAIAVHTPLRVLAFSGNVILRQCYELSKQLQELHTEVGLLSDTFETSRTVLNFQL